MAIRTPSADKWHRGLRSLAQVALVQGFMQLYNAFSEVDLTADQIAAITLVATPLLAFVQNFLEDAGTIPALGKTPPSTGANPA